MSLKRRRKSAFFYDTGAAAVDINSAVVSDDELSKIMVNAREDLGGNIQGHFSPADWEKILARARLQMQASSRPLPEAWVEAIRDFHRKKYWGFRPDYKKPKTNPEDENLGKRFIWYTSRSFLITKVVVLYCGARYSTDDDPIYKWLFFGAIGFMVLNYGIFLWRYGNRPER